MVRMGPVAKVTLLPASEQRFWMVRMDHRRSSGSLDLPQRRRVSTTLGLEASRALLEGKRVRLQRISMQRVWRGLSKMLAMKTMFSSIFSSWASSGYFDIERSRRDSLLLSTRMAANKTIISQWKLTAFAQCFVK